MVGFEAEKLALEEQKAWGKIYVLAFIIYVITVLEKLSRDYPISFPPWTALRVCNTVVSKSLP